MQIIIKGFTAFLLLFLSIWLFSFFFVPAEWTEGGMSRAVFVASGGAGGWALFSGRREKR